MTVLGYALSLRQDRTRVRAGYWIAACCLGLWILVQTVSLPVGVLTVLQPLAREDYQALFEGVGWTSISLDPFLTRATAILWAAYGLLAWTCARCLRSRRLVRRFLFCLVGIGVFQALFGIVVSGTGLWGSNPFATNRLTGTFSSGNSLGGFLALTLPTTFALLLSVAPRLVEDARGGNMRALLHSRAHTSQLITTLLLSIALVSQAVAILLSGSRGATISAAITSLLLILWFIFSAKESVRAGTVRIVLVSLAVVLVLGIGGAYAVISTRFSHLIEAGPAAAILRLEIWRGSWRLLTTHPLGVGPGCYSLAIQRFQPPGFGAARVYHAHSDYIEVLCELGLIGLIPFIGLAALFFGGAIRTIRRKSGGYSAWMWRGALLAVFSAFLHAFVDFNLTSRPGVAVAFFALVGVVLGYHPIPRQTSSTARHQVSTVPPVGGSTSEDVLPGGWAGNIPMAGTNDVAAQAPNEQASHSRRDTIRTRPRPSPSLWLRGVSLGLVCILLAVCEARRAIASWLVEGGSVSLGAERGKYFWLTPAQVKPEVAPATIRRARDIVPRYGQSHYAYGMGKIRTFVKQKKAVVEDNLARLPDLSEEEVGTLVHRAMALERAAAYSNARHDFLRALDLSPWDPDARVALSRCIAESAVSETDMARVEQLCRRAEIESRNAVRLAPSDAGTLARACSALSTCLEFLDSDAEPVEEIVDLIRKWGRRALWLEAGVDEQILRAWRAAGIPVTEAVESSDMPPRVLWRTYRFFDALDDSDNALECLSLLERTLTDTTRKAASFDREKVSREADNYGGRVVREKSRWFLRLGQWAQYQRLLEQREAVHGSGLDEEMRNTDGLSLRAQYLKLKSLQKRVGLDVKRELQLCRLEIDRADRHAAADALAELAILDKTETDPYLGRLLESETALPDDGFGWDMARTRVLLGRGEYGAAEDMLRALVDSRESPFRFRHRVRLLLARCMLERGDMQAARGVLVRAVEECPADPDTVETLLKYGGSACLVKDADGREVRAVELLAEIIPVYGVGMAFLGGKAELTGFDLKPGADRRRADAVLRLFWRFWGSVPSDLGVTVTSRNARGQGVYWRRSMFERADTTAFAAGRPRIGQTIVVDLALSWKARTGRALVIGLRKASNHEWLRSAEGLPYMEIHDWSKYVRDDVRPGAPPG